MVKLPVFFPSGFVSVVNVGDSVKVGQKIVSKAARKEYIIDVVKELSISADKARKCLTKVPGDIVAVGDVLAVNKGFWGLNEDKIVSQVDGTVLRYERNNGNLVIQVGVEGGNEDMVSPIDGIVVVCNNNSVVIETDKDVYSGIKGAGGDAIGEVFVLEDSFYKLSEGNDSDISVYYNLDSRAVGKIIIGGKFSRDLLIKSAGMGVVGVIGTSISDDDINYISGRRMALPIIEVDEATIKKIAQWKDKKIYLNSPEKHILLLRV